MLKDHVQVKVTYSKSPPKLNLPKDPLKRGFAIGGLILVAFFLGWSLVAAMLAFMIRPNHAGDLPPDYTPNDYLATAGFDFQNGVPFYVEGGFSVRPWVELLDGNSKQLKLGLHQGAHIYPISIPRDKVNAQSGDTNDIRLTWKERKISTFNDPAQAYRLVSNGGYSLWNAFDLKSSPPKNRVVKVPLAQTEEWNQLQSAGLGFYFYSNLDRLKKAVITLSGDTYTKYKLLFQK